LGPPSKAERDRTSILLRLPKPNAAGFIGDPYPLETCIVTDEPLGESPVVIVLKDQPNALQEGRQIKVKDGAAEARFLAEPARFLHKLDLAIVERQMPTYPLDRCLFRLELKLDADAVSTVFGNRLYRFSSDSALRNFNQNTERYVGTYDKMIAARQRSRYPLDTCVVAGEKLGAETQDVVIGHRLVRVCCPACTKKLLEQPTAYLAKVDAAIEAAAAIKAQTENTQQPQGSGSGPR
jgi:hypothetical protein